MRLVIALIVLVSRPTLADSIAYTCTAPSNVKAITEKGACKGFVAHDANGKEVQRVASGYFVSGSILATPDGKTVAMFHHFPISTGTFATKDALIFFRDGKPIAKYSMTDLVKRMDLVTHSTSHVNWVARGWDYKLELGKTFEVTTTSQRTYTFEVATGKQTSADDTADWKTCELIVYAGERIPSPLGGVYTIAKPWFAKGTAPAPLQLRADPKVRIDSGTTACVVKKAGGWHATKNIDVMFNALPK